MVFVEKIRNGPSPHPVSYTHLDVYKRQDLDRCYTISRLPADNGKELILINFHLSAYTTDPSVAENQLSMLYEDMTAEYEAGNYVVCGGDFNKDLLGDSRCV